MSDEHEPSPAVAEADATQEKRPSRFKRGAVVALALTAFMFPFARRIYHDGYSSSFMFFLLVPAAVMFLLIDPKRFGGGDKPRFDPTAETADRESTERKRTKVKWRR